MLWLCAYRNLFDALKRMYCRPPLPHNSQWQRSTLLVVVVALARVCWLSTMSRGIASQSGERYIVAKFCIFINHFDYQASDPVALYHTAWHGPPLLRHWLTLFHFVGIFVSHFRFLYYTIPATTHLFACLSACLLAQPLSHHRTDAHQRDAHNYDEKW